MVNRAVIGVVSLSLVSICNVVLGQDVLLGKYSGHRVGQRGGQSATELEIVSVDGNKVKGKLVRYYNRRNRTCNGAFPMEGTLSGNTLELSTTKTSDTIAGCETSLKVTVDGKKLSGTIGPQNNKLELSR